MCVSRACGIALLLSSSLVACGGEPPRGTDAAAAKTADVKAAEPAADATAGATAEPRDATPKRPAPELRPAGEGPVAELVVAELAAAADDQRRLVVYVGASWCEPCVAFHEAIAAGRIGAPLGGARFLEFDLDRDGDRLREAGYTSRLIPLFVVPEADGRAGSRRTEGGIKGPGAVDNLVRRLGPLLKD